MHWSIRQAYIPGNTALDRTTMIETLLDRFNLMAEREDYDTIHENIEKNTGCRGTNLWILISR